MLHYVDLNTHKHQSPIVAKAEPLLLWLFLGCRVIYFCMTFGREAGFDSGAHVEMVEQLSWFDFVLPIGRYFYSYHPPLGFLLAKVFTLFGFSAVQGVQLLNALASVATVLLVRATLRRCDLLSRPAPVFFLYLFACLPIQLFLASSINLDVLMAAIAALVTYLSVWLFWHGNTDRQTRITLALSIVVAIAAGLLIKFSGLLFTAIPVIVAIASPKRTFKLAATAGTVVAAALLLISPYYVSRYYLPTGHFFPTNLEIFAANEIAQARAERDRDGLAFFLALAEPSSFHGAPGEISRDFNTMRLADAWQDIWVKENHMGPVRTPAAGRTLGQTERAAASVLVVGGLFLTLWRLGRRDEWERLGVVWLSFACLQLAAFVSYLYSQPVASWSPTKGIYLACSLPIIAYAIAVLLPDGPGRRQEFIQKGALVGVALLLMAHHFIPIQ